MEPPASSACPVLWGRTRDPDPLRELVQVYVVPNDDVTLEAIDQIGIAQRIALCDITRVHDAYVDATFGQHSADLVVQS